MYETEGQSVVLCDCLQNAPNGFSQIMEYLLWCVLF